MYCGAIAGRVDDEGEISRNRFVENGSAGIDGVSYAGKAEPISYESLMAEENVPEEFGKFTLTYIADDTLAGRVSGKYTRAAFRPCRSLRAAEAGILRQNGSRGRGYHHL